MSTFRSPLLTRRPVLATALVLCSTSALAQAPAGPAPTTTTAVPPPPSPAPAPAPAAPVVAPAALQLQLVAEEAPPAAPETLETPTHEPPGYGPAGCGLGSLIFGNDTGFTQVFAATTNNIVFIQTFSITTGTSNCDTGGGVASTKAFVVANRAALSRDAARGSGETITSLTELAGCSAGSERVGVALQRQFGVLFPAAETSDAVVGDTVVGWLSAETTLGCRKLS